MHDGERPQRLLIVDDTPENINILGELLSEYKRVFALNGMKAIEKATSDNAPDLILLDIMMPEMDGFEVCRRLKENDRTRDIPIIFVTALGEDIDETKGLELGAVDYISKPFSPLVVKQRVKTHLELKKAKEELRDQNLILENKVASQTASLVRALRQIQKQSLEMIVRLSRAAEFRDNDTAAHLLRMSRYSATIARQMGWDTPAATELLYAATMHDVGKIGIPDKVLLKPGKLSDDEWRIMQNHCVFGHRILAGSNVPLIQLAASVAMTHHEKWDGTGYPRQLKGSDIPLSGRIVAVADVFDALTSKRPYKEPFSFDKSFQILKQGKGSHFDPEVVDAFFQIESVIFKINRKYQDENNFDIFENFPAE